jgi:uncharacterized MAPEG superfamily protein
MTIPLSCLLGFATWTVLLVFFGIGPYRVGNVLLGKARASAFPAAVPHGPDWYQRLMRAHANCVENLPVFGAVVLVAAASGYSSPTFDTLAEVVLAARVCQTIAHVSSGRGRVINIRFTFFLTQVVSMLAMIVLVARQ